MDFSKEEPNLPSDSDDSDEDYVPSGAESNPPSEVDSEGDDEDPPESEEETPSTKKRKLGQKASKKKARKKSRKSIVKEEVESKEKVDSGDDSDKKDVSEEEKKKHADSLWADFLSDTKPSIPQPRKTTTRNEKEETEEKIAKEKIEPKKGEKENKITITEVFEFAGEEVKITKQVAAASEEARGAQAAPKAVGSGSSESPMGRGRGRSPGGLSSLLGQLGKKSKIGTLEKSKLDWDDFKRSQGIEDELRTFNRGKEGYLEKQDFLQRTDLRQFEIEKSLRATRRSNR